MPALPSWLADPLWDQFAALLPPRPIYVATHPWGCHRRRIPDRVVFDKLIQVLRFGCSYEAIADTTCSATTLRDCRDEWIALGVFAQPGGVRPTEPDRPRVLRPHRRAAARPHRGGRVHHQSPRRRRGAGPSPVDRRKQGMKRSVLVEGYGIPSGRVLAGAQRHDSPLLAPTLDLLADLGPLPEEITVHLDAGYDSGKTRQTLTERGLGLRGQIAHKGEKAPIQASQRWHVERTNAWHDGFNRFQRCYERREKVINAFFDLADAIITVRSLIRRAWITHRWDTRPARRR